MNRNRKVSGFFCFLPAILALSFFAFILVLPNMASAAQVTLEWDANNESDLAGYRAFLRQRGENYDYSNPTWEGTETTCTISDLDENVRYSFVVRAYNTSSQQSGNSNEVTYIPGVVNVIQGAKEEIIATWSSGIWYWDKASSRWTKMYSRAPSGAIAAGDFTGDGRADVASVWSSGLWYQNGATLGWTRVSNKTPNRIATGDVTGDGWDEIIGCGGNWASGVWYRDVFNGKWYHPYSSTPHGAIAAGDVTGDSKADIISIWSNGLWYQNGSNSRWTRVSHKAPNRIAAGDVTGDGKADMISIWSNGLWYQDGATFGWTRVHHTAPDRITAGDINGN